MERVKTSQRGNHPPSLQSMRTDASSSLVWEKEETVADGKGRMLC